VQKRRFYFKLIMQNSSVNFRNKSRKIATGTLSEWLNEKIFIEKLNNPLGYLLLSIAVLALSYVIATKGFSIAIVVILGLVGLPMVFACMFNLKFGLVLIMLFSFALHFIKRTIPLDIPMGLVLDVLIYVMLFGIFVKQAQTKDWSFAKNPITTMVLVWMAFNLIQLGNPSATSREAWFYVARGMAGQMIIYFVALFAINKLSVATGMVKLWIGLSLAAALYGLYHEYFGLFNFEMTWLTSDEERYKLIYQWGKIRVFSFLSDPTVLGILLSYTTVLCFILMLGPFKYKQRVMLGIAGVCTLMAMLYTGTRTAYAMLPAGFLFYAVVTFRTKILIGMGIVFAIGAVIVIMPTSNHTLYRFKSAFNPAENDSYQVREKNQAFIKPVIQSHPIGVGLGSVGYWGRKFSPNSPLSNFPPDSGYVKIAIETGWIGLGLYCLMLFMAFKVGIRNYLLTRSPKIKALYLGQLSLFYALVVANFPQDAMTQTPTNVIFYLSLALFVKLRDFDTPEPLPESAEAEQTTEQRPFLTEA
jgi:putative inorganic carbon (hco3(-)) transporter